MNDILTARENRTKKVLELAQKTRVLTVKANVPGQDKNLPEAYILVRHVSALILQKFGGKCEIWQSDDGPVAVITESTASKTDTVELEEQNALGRFADVDVYEVGQTHSSTRGHMRKCYVCNRPAFVCGREGTHTTEELVNVLKTGIRTAFSVTLEQILKSSMMAELDLENKFGLVTPTSKGSHDDLDYALMQRAQNAILPHLVKMFWQGVDGSKNLLADIRKTGLEAEKSMLVATGGANAYKGLIFVMGIVSAAIGNTVCGGEVSQKIREICAGITNELKNENPVTNGEIAYAKHGVTGVRGEAENGFPAVFQASQMLHSGSDLLSVLTSIVGKIDDTVLLKRAQTVQNYSYFKQKISTVDVTDKQALSRLNDECIKNDVSIGGSADVLATAVFYNQICNLFVQL